MRFKDKLTGLVFSDTLENKGYLIAREKWGYEVYEHIRNLCELCKNRYGTKKLENCSMCKHNLFQPNKEEFERFVLNEDEYEKVREIKYRI